MSARAPAGGSDVAVVGGGVVGAATALAFARLGLSVVLVEARLPPAWSSAGRDLRVYALAPDNAGWLDALGAWAQVRAARAHPYLRMRVRDAAGGGELAFDADALGRRELGWIVEHGLLVDRLWAAVRQAGVAVHAGVALASLQQDDDAATLVLDDGSRLRARMAVAADGAGSALRGLAGIGIAGHAHGQRAIVAYVEGTEPHADTAWQRFLPGGPLALLPFGDDGRTNSIVWTRPDAEAGRLLAAGDDEFSRELTRASDRWLGALRVVSPRAAFPLRTQLASVQAAGRVVVVGDAAHVVHPLAGQGVNLGLRDASALAGHVARMLGAGRAWDGPRGLARWARERRSEAAVAAWSFDAINRIFSSEDPVSTLLRGPVLGAAGRLAPLRRALWGHAAGAWGPGVTGASAGRSSP